MRATDGTVLKYKVILFSMKIQNENEANTVVYSSISEFSFVCFFQYLFSVTDQIEEKMFRLIVSQLLFSFETKLITLVTRVDVDIPVK